MYKTHQEERAIMTVKKIKEDGEFTYFKVISSCCVKGLILQIDSAMFVAYFSREERNADKDFTDIYLSRNFIFPDKIAWWNANIKEVTFLIKANRVETEIKLLDMEQEYATKFHTDSLKFLQELYFFENFLTAYEWDGHKIGKCSKARKPYDYYRN